MTTPAVNINRVEKPVNSSAHFFRKSDGLTSVSHASGYLAHRYQSRPASVNSPWSGGPFSFRPPTPWKHQSSYIEVAGSDGSTESPQWRTHTGGVWPWRDIATAIFNANLVGPELVGLENRALTQAINNLRQGDLNLGTFLAELRQTAQMVANTATSIARQVRSFRRNNPKRVWRDIKSGCFRCKGASKWLELQYGWLPLLSDIYAALELLDHKWFEVGVLVPARSKASDTSERTASFTPIGWTGSATAVPATIKVETEHTCHIALWFKCTNPRQAVLSSLGLINPAEIVWEKVRYSFVVDWFLPIGPWLSSFSSDFGFDFASGTKSYKRECSGNVVDAGGFKNSGSNTVKTKGGLVLRKYEANYFSRTVYKNRPVPGFYVKNPFSVRHVANATALLVQAFR